MPNRPRETHSPSSLNGVKERYATLVPGTRDKVPAGAPAAGRRRAGGPYRTVKGHSVCQNNTLIPISGADDAILTMLEKHLRADAGHQ